MARAVYVSVVTLSGFVFDVSRIDGDTTFLFFRSVVDLVEGLHIFATEALIVEGQGDSGGQSSLAVVNVTNSTDIYVRFGTFKFLFSHSCY